MPARLSSGRTDTFLALPRTRSSSKPCSHRRHGKSQMRLRRSRVGPPRLAASHRGQLMSKRVPENVVDHVGSLKRPPDLMQTWRDWEAGKADFEQLHAIQDHAI